MTPLVKAIAFLAPLRWAARLLVGAANVIIPGPGRAEGPTVSEDDLLALAGVAVDDAAIADEERQLIENTIEFGDTIVREVMVPRPDMVTVASDFRVGDVMEIIILNGFSRLPVTGEGIDDITGIVYAKDLMRAERDGRGDASVTEFLRPATFVPETKKVASLLREMQSERFHLAIVVDEYGGTAGLVTLEDLIEELVGEIVDEYDVEEEPLEELPSGEISVNARMNIDDVNEMLDSELPEGDWDSVGGLLIGLLGHVPVEGEVAEVDGVRLRAEKVTAAASAASSSPGRLREVGLLHLRRPSERRKVHAAQRHPRHEGHDRVRQAADDPHAGARRAEPSGRAGRVRRHAGDPQAAHAARRAPQRDRDGRDRRCRRRVPGARRDRAGRPGRPVRRRRVSRRTRSSSSTRSTSRHAEQVLEQLRVAGELELSEYFPVSARTGTRRAAARRSDRRDDCPRDRRTTRTTW